VMEQVGSIELALGRTPAKFAVVEALEDDHRVLCLTDDEAEASHLAFELRRRGINATARRVLSRAS
jgi:precorrin-6B methylase 1